MTKGYHYQIHDKGIIRSFYFSFWGTCIIYFQWQSFLVVLSVTAVPRAAPSLRVTGRPSNQPVLPSPRRPWHLSTKRLVTEGPVCFSSKGKYKPSFLVHTKTPGNTWCWGVKLCTHYNIKLDKMLMWKATLALNDLFWQIFVTFCTFCKNCGQEAMFNGECGCSPKKSTLMNSLSNNLGKLCFEIINLFFYHSL